MPILLEMAPVIREADAKEKEPSSPLEPAVAGMSIQLQERIRDLEQSLREERRALMEAEQRYQELEQKYQQLAQRSSEPVT